MNPTPVILMADDDPEDRDLTREAFAETGFDIDFRAVESGPALFKYLSESCNDDTRSPWPHLILLDLNMPGLDGMSVLQRLKQSDAMAALPVIVLTTSCDDDDVEKAYKFGAQSFVTKPVSFDSLVHVLTVLKQYWFDEVAQLPMGGTHA